VLGRALADLRDRSREAGRAQGPAQAAADLLQNQAPQAMDQGVAQLAQGRPGPAREAQRRAAELVERAAQQAEDLVDALHGEAPAEADPARALAEGDAPPADLGSARDALRAAGRQLAQARDPASAPGASEVASAEMRRAARGLRAASQPPAADPPAPSALAGQPAATPPAGEPAGPMLEPKESEAGTTDADLSELQDAVRARTGRAWGELPGHLRTEILQRSQGRYRDDYARLIQLYFREIAARESASPPGTPP
jgi:hypothetical protein